MPGSSKPDARRPLRSLARALVRMTLTAVDRGVDVVRSSTRGLQELIEEARDEYEAEKASAQQTRVARDAAPKPGSVVEKVDKSAPRGRRAKDQANGMAAAETTHETSRRPRKTSAEAAGSETSHRKKAAAASAAATSGETPRRGRGRPPRTVDTESAASTTGKRRKSPTASGGSGHPRATKSTERKSAAGAETTAAAEHTEAHSSEGHVAAEDSAG